MSQKTHKQYRKLVRSMNREGNLSLAQYLRIRGVRVRRRHLLRALKGHGEVLVTERPHDRYNNPLPARLALKRREG